MKSRPVELKSTTTEIQTPSGDIFVTLGYRSEELFEIIVNGGKRGSEVYAFTEALCRLMNIILRLEGHEDSTERVWEIVGQLGGIGGSRQFALGDDGPRSLPDAIAILLEKKVQNG